MPGLDDTALDALRLLIPEAADGALDPVLRVCLDAAHGFALAYTFRSTLPAALESACVQLALVFLNRRGFEGLASMTVGDVSRACFTGQSDLPESVMGALAAWRRLPGGRG